MDGLKLACSGENDIELRVDNYALMNQFYWICCKILTLNHVNFKDDCFICITVMSNLLGMTSTSLVLKLSFFNFVRSW